MMNVTITAERIYVTSDLCEGVSIFKIVDKIPEGFFVWNIGDNMGTDEYIPLCEDLHPEDKDDFSIKPDTLKAIKLSKEEVKALRCAANVGVNCLADAKKALNSKRRGYWSDRKRDQAKKVIDIFKKITA
ncbi:MAG: hypothetical protein ACI4EU_02880 [Butyrivibrio sp.]